MAFTVPPSRVAQVDIGTAPIGEQRIRTPEAAFGGATARGLQGLGQAAQQSAGILGNIAIERQDRQDTTEAVNAFTSFRDQWRGLDGDFKKREGIESFGLTTDAVKAYDDLSLTFGKTLTGGAKRRFESLARQSRGSSIDVLARFEQSQSKRAFDNQMGALSATAISDGIENFQDKNVLENSELVIDSSVRTLLRGQSEEAIALAIEGEMTKLHAGVTDRLSDIDPDTADDYLKANAQKMDPTVVAKLQQSLEVKVSRERSEELVAEHYIEDKPINEITKEIRKSGQPQKIIDDAVRRAGNRRAEDNAADREKRETSYQAGFDAVRDGNGIDSIPTAILNELTPEDITKLQAEDSRVANGHALVTNSKTWQDIMTMSPQELASKDVYRDYASQLDQTDFQRALNMQGKARADISGTRPNPAQVRDGDYRDALQFVARQAGLIKGAQVAKERIQTGGDDANRLRIFDQAYRGEVDAWLANNPGKQLSRTQIVELGNKLIADQVYLDGGFFGLEFQLPVAALTPTDIENAYIQGDAVIPEVRRFIIDAFPDRRRALTRDDIADIFLDIRLKRPIDKVSASDIPPTELTLIKAAMEQQGIQFNNEVERDQAFVNLYVKGLLNALR